MLRRPSRADVAPTLRRDLHDCGGRRWDSSDRTHRGLFPEYTIAHFDHVDDAIKGAVGPTVVVIGPDANVRAHSPARRGVARHRAVVVALRRRRRRPYVDWSAPACVARRHQRRRRLHVRRRAVRRTRARDGPCPDDLGTGRSRCTARSDCRRVLPEGGRRHDDGRGQPRGAHGAICAHT